VATLENNYQQFPANQGAVREGPALLQGLVWCKHCGRKMRVCYHDGQPYYTCDGAHRTDRALPSATEPVRAG
jgi:Recombinase zinc beta ribbon domain